MFSEQIESGVLEGYCNLQGLKRRPKVHNNTKDPHQRSVERILVCCVLGFRDQLSTSYPQPLKALCTPIFPFPCMCVLSQAIA